MHVSDEVVPGPSVFPSGEPGVSGDFWASGCEGKLGVALESLQGLRDLT